MCYIICSEARTLFSKCFSTILLLTGPFGTSYNLRITDTQGHQRLFTCEVMTCRSAYQNCRVHVTIIVSIQDVDMDMTKTCKHELVIH